MAWRFSLRLWSSCLSRCCCQRWKISQHYRCCWRYSQILESFGITLVRKKILSRWRIINCWSFHCHWIISCLDHPSRRRRKKSLPNCYCLVFERCCRWCHRWIKGPPQRSPQGLQGKTTKTTKEGRKETRTSCWWWWFVRIIFNPSHPSSKAKTTTSQAKERKASCQVNGRFRR